MDGLELAVLAAMLAALLLFVAYLSAARRERGQDPRYAREVYLYAPAPGRPTAATLADAERVAASFGAALATEAQVGVYAAAGGDAPGCGFAASGRALRTLPPRAGATADGCDPRACGAWLYGPKPPRLTPGVAPFAGARWFQP